jgi:hypothetical protein
MKIPESIIEKYQLTPSSNHIGEAVIHDLQCFKSALSGFQDVLFMECDFMGRPSKDIIIFNKGSKRKIAVTPEYLNAMAIVDILKFVV